MQQGSGAGALVARTAGMTDEQILDLDLDALETKSPGPPAQGAEAPWATTLLPESAGERRDPSDPHTVRSNAPDGNTTG